MRDPRTATATDIARRSRVSTDRRGSFPQSMKWRDLAHLERPEIDRAIVDAQLQRDRALAFELGLMTAECHGTERGRIGGGVRIAAGTARRASPASAAAQDVAEARQEPVKGWGEAIDGVLRHELGDRAVDAEQRHQFRKIDHHKLE